MIKIKPRALPHMFKPSETVEAILKKLNRHDVIGDELTELLREYKRINGDEVPRAGQTSLIPILTRHHAAVFGKP